MTAMLTRYALVVVALFAPAVAMARGAPENFADLAEKLLPSVVNISTTQRVQAMAQGRGERGERSVPMPQFPPGSPFEDLFKDFFDRDRGGERNDAPARRATSLGSGFVIDPTGFIVTNNHVIAEADEIFAIFADGQRLKAKLIARDAKTDLALLKVEAPKPLPALKWGSSEKARVGEWVLAIGNPFGLGGTVTAGIISAKARDINSGQYDDFLQTDAPINRGNSGGPLFNMAGEVIGVNSAIYSPTGGSVGIGFAIPSQLAANVVGQLKDHGRTRRGWLGVRIQTVTDELAESLSLPKSRGALVASVQDDSPAKKAGIEPGDVIVTFAGKEVTAMRGLPRLVAEHAINADAKVELWRKGKTMTVTVKVGELDEKEQVAAVDPKAAPPAAAGDRAQALGLTFAALNPDLRKKFDIKESVKGVVVTEVAPNSDAAQQGIRPGDVIVGINGEDVAAPKDVAEKVKKVQSAKRNSVALFVERAGDRRWVAVKLGEG